MGCGHLIARHANETSDAASLIPFRRALPYVAPVPESPRDHRFAEVDEKTRDRIVRAYVRDGLSVKLLEQRFPFCRATLRRILADAGVPLRQGATAADFHRCPL